MDAYQICLKEEVIVAYRDKDIEVRAKEIGFGCWESWIRNLKTGREKTGPYCPGNPNNFIFDPDEERWIFTYGKTEVFFWVNEFQ